MERKRACVLRRPPFSSINKTKHKTFSPLCKYARIPRKLSPSLVCWLKFGRAHLTLNTPCEFFIKFALSKSYSEEVQSIVNKAGGQEKDNQQTKERAREILSFSRDFYRVSLPPWQPRGIGWVCRGLPLGGYCTLALWTKALSSWPCRNGGFSS